jgi:hypothetical protein
MPITDLSDPAIDAVLTPAEWREHLEGSIKNEIDSDEIVMAIAALLGLLGMGATVVIARLVGRRQGYWPKPLIFTPSDLDQYLDRYITTSARCARFLRRGRASAIFRTRRAEEAASFRNRS